MRSGKLETTFVSYYEVNPYYHYEVVTTWNEQSGVTTWETGVISIASDGTRRDESVLTHFNFARFAPLSGEVPGASGHREALEAHRKVLFLVMG